MRIYTSSNLTDNAWVRRVGELRQMVNDAYDPDLGDPGQFVGWFVDYDDSLFYDDDVRVLVQEAQRIYDDYKGQQS